jgi:hypothetical protein
MTKSARIVLQDVEHAIDKHSNALGAEEFRVSWFGIVSLLRAVGHVLDKVDGQRSPELSAAIEQKWKSLQASKPLPDIFWGFIEPERNNFLKTYEHSVMRTFEIPMKNEDDSRSSITMRTDIGRSQGMGFSDEPFNLESVIESGPFKGLHEKSVARLAVTWWREYLDEIDVLEKNYADKT